MLDYTFDKAASEKYGGLVAGTDEAGRGPLFGSVVAAAVVLPEGLVIEELDDSKKLTEKKRERLYGIITEKALAYSIAECTAAEIDEYNILSASLLAMKRALDEVRSQLDVAAVLVDGNKTRDFGIPSETVVKGDSISQSIAAASVLAKVTRDRQIVALDEKYPLYGLAKHKGYPTAEHMLAVYEHGPSDMHRRSFLSFLETKRDMLEAQLQKKRELMHEENR